MDKKYYPISNGCQFLDWTASNCERCTKYVYPVEGEGLNLDDLKCDIDRALAIAFFDDGSVSREIAERMGYFENKFKLVWMCPEVEWTEEWKKEYAEIQKARSGVCFQVS